MKRTLTEDEQKMLGTKGVCENCGAEGKWCTDPYNEEIYGEETLVCLCDCCYDRYCEDI